jgi:periplasmic divalent cation tolerance protein
MGDADAMATGAMVMTTVASDEDADRLAAGLVEGRLAASVQRLIVRSTYRWQGELRTEPEVLLLIKTASRRMDDVVAHLELHHPYDVPEILSTEAGGSAAYLSWLAEETK